MIWNLRLMNKTQHLKPIILSKMGMIEMTMSPVRMQMVTILNPVMNKQQILMKNQLRRLPVVFANALTGVLLLI